MLGVDRGGVQVGAGLPRCGQGAPYAGARMGRRGGAKLRPHGHHDRRRGRRVMGSVLRMFSPLSTTEGPGFGGASRRRSVSAAAPTGTVALVFTDVQGSTRLWERCSGGMRDGAGRARSGAARAAGRARRLRGEDAGGLLHGGLRLGGGGGALVPRGAAGAAARALAGGAARRAGRGGGEGAGRPGAPGPAGAHGRAPGGAGVPRWTSGRGGRTTSGGR